MKKVFKLIKGHKNKNIYSGEQDVVHMQYGYHHGNQCNYLEVCLISKNSETFKYFKTYQQLFYLLDDREVILNRAIEKLKDYHIFIDEIQLLTEADIAFEEALLDG